MIRPLVVVPTRNRASLARAAITSVLDQVANGHILVSDNSTEPAEVEELARFCAGLDPATVTYARPARPLPMTPHWQWALQRGLQRPGLSHVLYLTDRMVFKQGALHRLLDLADHHPDRVISYNHDRIDDVKRPVRLEQRDWTGSLFDVPSGHLLDLTARAIVPPCLPRMLNCIAPLKTLAQLEHRFGSVFGSASPDYAFAYRLLATVDGILYWDASPLIHYALDRSNGASLARGIASKDSLDFIANLDEATTNAAAPVPAFRTATNPIFHEYGVVRAEVGGLPPVDRFQYLGMMDFDYRQLRDPATARAMSSLLRAQGWTARKRAVWTLQRLLPYLRHDPTGALSGAVRRAPAFTDAAAAIDYANRRPRPPRPRAQHFYLWPLTHRPTAVREVQAAGSMATPVSRAA
jgi:glycosyltransferase involved in cell wall biosynthesis